MGGEFTPHIITSGNPHDPGLGRSKKSPWGDYTSCGHAFISTSSLQPGMSKVSIREIQPLGEFMQFMRFSLDTIAPNDKSNVSKNVTYRLPRLKKAVES